VLEDTSSQIFGGKKGKRREEKTRLWMQRNMHKEKP
jgi:hypothetical protein